MRHCFLCDCYLLENSSVVTNTSHWIILEFVAPVAPGGVGPFSWSELVLLFWDLLFGKKYSKIYDDLVPVARLCELFCLDIVELEGVNKNEYDNKVDEEVDIGKDLVGCFSWFAGIGSIFDWLSDFFYVFWVDTASYLR